MHIPKSCESDFIPGVKCWSWIEVIYINIQLIVNKSRSYEYIYINKNVKMINVMSVLTYCLCINVINNRDRNKCILEYKDLFILTMTIYCLECSKCCKIYKVFTLQASGVGVLSSRSRRAGGRLLDVRNPYFCNCLMDFLCSKFCGIVSACSCVLP